ncbi:MAG: TonB-dependent receptor, partial [Hyphomicrobiales bacterium]|nr:TonB-dependent receptor [Hyphomicrobiales bacterium]
VKQRNAAVFGQGTYGVTDQLVLTLGARYDYVKKDLQQSDPTQPAAPEGTASETFTAFLPKAAIEYRWTPDFNTYVTVAHGYKPGGFPVFNTGNRSATDPYDSEYTWNYEVGAKASLLADRLLLGASAFYIDIDNQQIRTSTRPGLAPVENIRKSRSIGFELSASGLVTPEWEVFGDFGFTDAKVEDIGDPTIISTFNGARPAHVPRYEATLGTQYKGQSGLFVRASGTLTGPYYLNSQNTTKQESFLLLDAKVGWEFDNFNVYGFVENILDEEYLTRSFSGTLPGQGNVGRQGAPRTFGVFVSAQF